MKTISFGETIYKLVPFIPTDEMSVAGFCVADYDPVGVYRVMLALVPTSLPGVVEHSGEPYGITDTDAYGNIVVLYDHPSAQPDTTEQISDEQIEAIWHALWGNAVSAAVRRKAFARALLAAAQPDTEALQARIAELELDRNQRMDAAGDSFAELREANTRIAELEAQLAAQAEQSQIYLPCKGKNCGATDGKSHSIECFAEHYACVSRAAQAGKSHLPTKAWCDNCNAVTPCGWRWNNAECADLCCSSCDSILVCVHEFAVPAQPDTTAL